MKTPWYYGWNVIGFCIVFQALSFGAVFYSFAIMAIPLTQAFNVSLSQIMLATVCLQIGIGVFSPILGRALDIIRLRNLVSLGAVSLSLGFIIMANTATLWVMLVVYGVLLPVGLILAGSIAAQTAAARWFVRKRGFALGLSAVGTSIGAFIFPPMVEYFISHKGLSSTFLILAWICALIIIPLAWLILHRDPDESDLANEAQVSDTTPSAIDDDRDWSTAEVLKHRPFWIIICSFAPICASFTAVQFNLGAYARDQGLDPAQAAYLLSIFAAAMVAGKFFFAALADRQDHRMLFWIMALGQGAVLLALQFSPTYPLLVAIVVVFGFSMGGGLPLLAAITADQFGVKAFGRIIGIIMLFITAASAAGPYFTALMYDTTGVFNTAFSVIACLLIPGTLWIISLKRQQVFVK